MNVEPVTELTTPDELDRLLAEAGDRPLLLYKHSLTCGTSGLALEEIHDVVPLLPPDVRLGIVKVQRARPLSTLVAQRFDVRHESPQVLLIVGGQVVWHASHFRVTAAEIRAALGRLGLTAAAP